MMDALTLLTSIGGLGLLLLGVQALVGGASGYRRRREPDIVSEEAVPASVPFLPPHAW